MLDFRELDNAGRHHFSELIQSWLKQANLPSSFANTLGSLLIPLVSFWIDAQHDTKSTTVPEHSFSYLYDSIHIQTLGLKTIQDSKFLPGVYHGESLAMILSSSGFNNNNNLGGSRCEWLHHVVGGTLRIYGTPSGPAGDQLMKIVAASVYTLWSMWLELNFLQDYDVSYLQPPPLVPQHEENNVVMQGIIYQRRSALVRWLWPKANIVEAKTKKINKIKSKSNLNEKKQVNGNEATAASTKQMHFPMSTKGDDLHRFSKLRKQLEDAYTLSTSCRVRFPAPRLVVRLQDEEDGINTIRTVMRMKNNNDTQTTIPKSGKPNMLKRRASSLLSLLAHNNNNSNNNQQQQQSTQPKLQSAPAQQQQQGLFEVPQSISAYSSLRCCNNDKKIGMDGLLLDTQSVDGFLQHQQITVLYAMHPIGCPQSPCAGPLLSRLNYFQYELGNDRSLGDTVIQWCQQAESGMACNDMLKSKLTSQLLTESPTSLNGSNHNIPTPSIEDKKSTTSPSPPNNNNNNNNTLDPSSKKTTPDSSSKSTTLSVESPEEKENHYNHRRTSSSILQSSLNGCQKPLADHVMTFTHGPGKIVVSITKNVDASLHTKKTKTTTATAEVSPCGDSNKTLSSSCTSTVETWFTCSTCDAETPAKPLSMPTYHYSLGKFFELVLYLDYHFAPAIHPICGHVVSPQTSMIHCFRPSAIPTYTVKITFEPISLYELRAPRLQVVPTPQETTTKTAAKSVVSTKTLKNWQGQIRDDVNALFEAVDAHIDVLKQFMIAESKRVARSSLASRLSSSAANHHQEKQQEIQAQLKLRQNELDSMKRLFGETEHRELILELQQTSLAYLNDYRRFFALRSGAILSQISKWQQQWCPDLMDDCTWDPPDYIKSNKVHAFPGSSVLVREEEPSSIIAYTLSSSEYIKELKQQQNEGNGSTNNTVPPSSTSSNNNIATPPSISSTTTSSTVDDHVSPQAKKNDHYPQEHPVNDTMENGNNTNNESYYSFIKRKFVAPNAGASSETASFRSMVIETVKANASELHYQQQRKVNEIKERWTSSPAITEDKKKRNSNQLTTTSSQRIILDEPRIQRDITTEVTTSTFYQKQPPPPSPPLSNNKHHTKEKPLPPITNNTNNSTHTNSGENRRLSPHIKHSSVSRIGAGRRRETKEGGGKWRGDYDTRIKKRKLLMDILFIEYIHNNVEFTCTVYYASEFETLRRQSGIDQLLIQSLSRCNAWKATGGKSKSHFYLSQDGRLVIKEMVNAWNNVEKESILKFAPKYFDYMKKIDETPSVLAKIFGFYTIRIRSTVDKRILLNLDVLVMEHLFYGIVPQNIQKFDFKGIRDRHVETSCRKQGDTTLWDGDWLQDYRLGCPVNEQSKAFIEKAIKSDTEFLTKGNIMDYSLLLGVDEAKKELTVGIVDFIGAYTWYKKVESRSKSTLNPNKEVTVIPPDQYKWRFYRIINDYFVAVSGKFDKVHPNHLVSSNIIL
ncbi:hypothetical protein BDA99DRAFT_510606 [Phascolomyces articulosus]|uniref:PIPK domain-containing protein n=1 Tax=Phascolomyces articulosus TaxID=60185 RepID=A0AAD5PDX4_9FUNG|nr:hypothetical protein BDA99DRAFT_510606 [Phascolomyces articulosus]